MQKHEFMLEKSMLPERFNKVFKNIWFVKKIVVHQKIKVVSENLKAVLHGTICMIRFVRLLFGFKIWGALTWNDLYDTIRWLKHIIIQTCLFKLFGLYLNWKYNEWGTYSCSNCHCNNFKKEKHWTKKKMKNGFGEALAMQKNSE